LQPVTGPGPKVGDVVAFDISDLGRVQLGGSMGPEISQVEGRLLDSENGDYIVGVTSVRTIRYGLQVWSGERVRIQQQHVARTYQRRFSRSRTALFGLAAAGGFVFMFGRNLGVLGGKEDEEPPVDTVSALIPRRR
jgi:hypothetical protein